MATLAVPGIASPVPGGTGESVSWRGLLLAGVLLVAAFGPALVAVVRTWWENAEYSHGFLVVGVALWLLYIRRERLRALAGGTSLLAVPLLVLCVIVLLVGALDFMTSLSSFAFVGGLGAVLLAFLGWHGLRACMPVLVVLVLACPLPGVLHQALTLPLREVSARFAVGLLHLSGVPTFLDGHLIHLEGADSLWVADACSGIHSLISLLSLAVIACLLWRRHWLLKALVVLATVPIAVLVNGLRIWLTGYLSVRSGLAAAEGAFHFLEGFVLFALAGLLLLGFVAALGVVFPRGAP